METTFTELRSKEVINALTGKILGNICDVVMDLRCNRILGFVVPGSKNFFSFFKPAQEIFIPFSQVCRIGEDIILVEVAEPTAKRQKNKSVRVFETQGQTSTSSKEFQRTTGEAKSIYPAASSGYSGAAVQQPQNFGGGNANGNSSFVSHNFASGQATYPTGNVTMQCSNCNNATLDAEPHAYDSTFGKHIGNNNQDMTDFEHDDIYPIN